MTPEKLRKIWPEKDLVVVPLDQVDRFPFRSKTKEYLTISGLPAGFEEISFDDLKERLKTVNEIWGLKDSSFDRYISIGSNGSGDPVAINLENNDSIVYLNHDNYFQEVLINSDLDKLVASVVRLHEFSNIKKPLKQDSLWITEFSDEEFESLKNDLAKIDSEIFEHQESHWKYTIDYYLWEREEERNR